MHDGISFESAGKPAATIVSETFVPLARAKRSAMNLEEYSFIVVPHPLGDEARIRVKAVAAAPEVVRALTSGGTC